MSSNKFLKSKGFVVFGIDISEDIINIAKSKSKDIEYHIGDMRNINLGKFDVAISMNNASSHLSKLDFEISVKNVYNNLNANDLYIFDILNYHFIKNYINPDEFIGVSKDINGVKIVRFNKNKLNSKLKRFKIIQKTYIQEDYNEPSLYKANYDMQIYTHGDIVKILNKNGSEVLKISDSPGNIFNEDFSASMIVVAMKR